MRPTTKKAREIVPEVRDMVPTPHLQHGKGIVKKVSGSRVARPKGVTNVPVIDARIRVPKLGNG